jgi:hypothetical protein
LADFVRCRELTCRAPGCDKPATHCDLDHTVPYPVGPTHASNIKCLCRFHHLLKTFCGWADRQLPDGTVIWMSPSGQAHSTHPGGRLADRKNNSLQNFGRLKVWVYCAERGCSGIALATADACSVAAADACPGIA